MLKVFGFDDVAIGNSESLDITQNNEGNAVLLAMSVILQGYRSTAEFSELLANMITDISHTGTVQTMYGSKLIDDARFFKFGLWRAKTKHIFYQVNFLQLDKLYFAGVWN